MDRKAVISVMVGIALLLSLGAWVKDAAADAILFPWVVRSADVTTVISVVNTAETEAEALGLPFHNNRIHVEYWHKLTTANDQEEKSQDILIIQISFLNYIHLLHDWQLVNNFVFYNRKHFLKMCIHVFYL